MILVFDLDDTLYDEITFVQSGFYAFSYYLSKKYSLNKDSIYKRCLEILNKEGRGKIFDIILKENLLFSNKELLKSITIYRNHQPKIKLFSDAISFLKNNSKSPLYIVTDGNKLVQRKKIQSLKLYKYVKKAYPTRQFGIKYEKPSPYVFLKIAERESVQTSEIIYFGDNPYKDFIGLKPLGFKTIRLKRGSFSNITLDENHEAHITFNNFNEITTNTLISLINA